MDGEQRKIVDEVRAVLGPLFVGLLVLVAAAVAEVASLAVRTPSRVDRRTEGGSRTS